MNTSSQPSTEKSSQHGLETTYMAATRTLLAMVRTGAGIAGGGALVTELLAKGWPRWVLATVSAGFVIVGYWLMWAALRKGRELRDRLEPKAGEEGFLFPHREVTIVTVALQVLIATVVALYIIGPMK